VRLLSTLGWIPAVVVSAVERIKPDKVVVFYGSEGDDNRVSKALENVIMDIGKDVEVIPVKIDDPMDMRECMTKMKPHISEDSISNITGGTKIMSFSLALLSASRGVPIIYIRRGGDEREVEVLPITINMESSFFLGEDNSTKMEILKVLCEMGGKATQRDVRDEVRRRRGLSESSTTIYEAISQLEAMNIIEKTRNKGDSRINDIRLKDGAYLYLECDENE
jgi:CRISPR-associated protein Csa3